MPQDVSIAAGQAGRPLPAFTVQMHQDLAFDSAEAFRQAVARDVEQCIATAHLRSIAALPEEDGEPAVGSGGEPQTKCSHAHKGHGAPVSLGLRPEVHQSDVPGGAAQWATLWHATTSHDQDVECLACMGRKWPACGHRAAAFRADVPDSCAVCAGTKRKAVRAASPVRAAASREERQAEQEAARSEASVPASRDGIRSKQADSPPAAKRQRHRQQVEMQTCLGSVHCPVLHTCHAQIRHTCSAQVITCQLHCSLTPYTR